MSTFLPLRAAATESVVELLRDQPMSWEGANCIRLARAQAVAMGHDVPPVPRFKTRTGALRALKKQGANTMAELLDRFFERHDAPAFALVGDLVLLPGEDDEGARDDTLGAVCISDGRGNLFGWIHPDLSRMQVIKQATAHAVAAWRL